MKKLFILLVLTILVYSSGVAEPANSPKSIPRTEEYCELKIIPRALFRNSITARVDFGEGDDIMKDETGKQLEFASNMAVLNYMNSQGWELVTVHTKLYEGDSNTYYVMKRRLE